MGADMHARWFELSCPGWKGSGSFAVARVDHQGEITSFFGEGIDACRAAAALDWLLMLLDGIAVCSMFEWSEVNSSTAAEWERAFQTGGLIAGPGRNKGATGDPQRGERAPVEPPAPAAD